MHTTIYERNIRGQERQTGGLLETDSRPDLKFHPLEYDEPVTIDTTEPMAFEHSIGIVAELQLGQADDRLLVLKVDTTPTADDGFKYPFGPRGPRVSPEAHLLVVNRHRLRERLGIQDFVDDEVVELKLGESVNIGRRHHQGKMTYTQSVSRHHTRLSLDRDGYLQMEDKGSTNGTWYKALPRAVEEGEQHKRTEAEEHHKRRAVIAARLAREGYERDLAVRRAAQQRRAAEAAAEAARQHDAQEAARHLADAHAQQEAYLRKQAQRDAEDLARRKAAQAKANRARTTSALPIKAPTGKIGSELELDAGQQPSTGSADQRLANARAQQEAFMREQAARDAEDLARRKREQRAANRVRRAERSEAGRAYLVAEKAQTADREAANNAYLETIQDEEFRGRVADVSRLANFAPIESIHGLLERIVKMRTTKSDKDVYKALAREYHSDRPETASEELFRVLTLIYDTHQKHFWHFPKSKQGVA